MKTSKQYVHDAGKVVGLGRVVGHGLLLAKLLALGKGDHLEALLLAELFVSGGDLIRVDNDLSRSFHQASQTIARQ